MQRGRAAVRAVGATTAATTLTHAPMRRGQACRVARKSARGTGCAGGAEKKGLRLGAAAAALPLTVPPVRTSRCRLGGGASPSLSGSSLALLPPSSSLPLSPLCLPSGLLASLSSASNCSRRRLAAGCRRSGASSCGQGRGCRLSGRLEDVLAVRAGSPAPSPRFPPAGRMLQSALAPCAHAWAVRTP